MSVSKPYSALKPAKASTPAPSSPATGSGRAGAVLPARPRTTVDRSLGARETARQRPAEREPQVLRWATRLPVQESLPDNRSAGAGCPGRRTTTVDHSPGAPRAEQQQAEPARRHLLELPRSPVMQRRPGTRGARAGCREHRRTSAGRRGRLPREPPARPCLPVRWGRGNGPAIAGCPTRRSTTPGCSARGWALVARVQRRARPRSTAHSPARTARQKYACADSNRSPRELHAPAQAQIESRSRSFRLDNSRWLDLGSAGFVPRSASQSPLFP
jgi:hypothetical protein